jgi:hypothetical protein
MTLCICVCVYFSSNVAFRISMCDVLSYRHKYVQNLCLVDLLIWSYYGALWILGGKGRPARKPDNLSVIWEPTVQKMWEPRRLTTLLASTACYRENFTFLLYLPGTCRVFRSASGLGVRRSEKYAKSSGVVVVTALWERGRLIKRG